MDSDKEKVATHINKYHLVAISLLLFLASLLFYQNFSEKGIIIYVDMTFPMPIERLFNTFTQTWYEWGSYSNLANINRLFFMLPSMSLVLLLSLSYKSFLLTLFIITYALSGISMYFLVGYLLIRYKFCQHKKTLFLISLSSAIFYMFNPWSLGHLWTFFIYPSYSLIPLIVLIIDSKLNTFSLRWIILLAILTSFASTSPHGIIWVFLIVFFWFLLMIINRVINIKSAFRILLLFMCFYLVINFYWILPYASTIFQGNAVKPPYKMSPELLNYSSSNNNMINSFRYSSGWGYPIEPPKGDIWWSFVSIFLLIICFIPLISYRKNQTIIFLSIASLVTFLLSYGTSTSSPISQWYMWISLYSPISNLIGWVFRAPDRWLSLTLFFLSILMGISSSVIFNKTTKKIKFYSFLVIFILILSAFAFSIVPLAKSYSLYVFSPTEIPNEYSKVNEWLDNNDNSSKLYWLPIYRPSGYNYSWEPTKRIGAFSIYSSTNPSLNSFNSLFDTSSFNYWFEDNIILGGKRAEVSKLIGQIGVKYIILDKSISHSSGLQQRIDLDKYIKLVYDIGNLSVYELLIHREEVYVPKRVITTNSMDETLLYDSKIPFNQSVTYFIKNPSFKINFSSLSEDLLTDNLIYNSSLEEYLDYWSRTKRGTNFSMQVINESPNNKVLMLTTDSDSKNRLGWVIGNEIKIRSNESYLIKDRMKWKNTIWSHVVIEGFNKDSKKWQQLIHCPEIQSGSSDWKDYSCMIYINTSIEKIRPALAGGWVQNKSIGNASTFFEDIKILKVNDSKIKLNIFSKSPPGLLFNSTKISPTHYTVNINASEPFMLSFAESYDPLWVAKTKINGTTYEFEPVPLYSVINGFWINQTGNLDITIEYKPQKWFYIGSAISGATLLGCIGYLVYDWWKRRPKKKKPEVNANHPYTETILKLHKENKLSKDETRQYLKTAYDEKDVEALMESDKEET